MPELPEVEITARRLTAGLAGARVESALAPGMVALKTFDPPLDALTGTSRGKIDGTLIRTKFGTVSFREVINFMFFGG